MEWTVKLEAKAGSGEVTTFDVGTLRRAVGDLSADGLGLSLAEAKALLAELQQRIVQSQIDEYVTSVCACPDCMRPRRLRDARASATARRARRQALVSRGDAAAGDVPALLAAQPCQRAQSRAPGRCEDRSH